MSQFEFFFGFYSIVLGLAATETLGGLGALVRARATARLDPRTLLLALFTFLAICTAWIDAWNKLQEVTIDFAGLWAPILTATFYYLAATTVFPTAPPPDGALPSEYFESRKRFTIAMLFAAELVVGWVYLPTYAESAASAPAIFWLFHLPYKLMLLGLMTGLFLLRRRAADLACLAALNVLLLIPYWGFGWISRTIAAAYGYTL